MKKISSRFVFMLLAALCFTLPAAAEETTQLHTEPVVYVNPLYEEVITEEDILAQTAGVPSAGFYSYSQEDYFDTIEEAAPLVREALVNRESVFTVPYTMSYEEYSAHIETDENGNMIWNHPVVTGLLEAAWAHTGNPEEGDYIQWQIGYWNIVTDGALVGSYVNLSMTYNISYYTTPEQEQALTEQINAVMPTIVQDGMSDYEKVRAIYDYICTNVTYDNDNLNDASYMLKYTAYAAMMNGTAVCQGYANLFYRMALEAGVDSRLIAGIGNGGPHAWNIVALDGLYYNLDATWDASYAANDMEYAFFLRTDATFADHYRDTAFATEVFIAAYPMAAADYGTSDAPDAEEGITWKYDSDTRTLTIGGTGAMEDYDWQNKAPWYDYGYSIWYVVVEEGVTYIGNDAFTLFTEMRSISLPSTLQSMSDNLSYNLHSVTDITVNENNPVFFTEDGVLFERREDGDTNLRWYPAGRAAVSYVIPDHVAACSARAFADAELTELTLPDRFIEVGDSAFDFTDVFGSVIVPAGFVNISERIIYALRAANFVVAEDHPTCQAVDGVLYDKDMKRMIAYPVYNTAASYTIPDGVQYFVQSIFGGTIYLQELSIPASVTEFGTSNFATSECVLQSIVVAEENKVFSSENGVLFNKDKTELIRYPVKKSDYSYTIPETVRTIRNSAFYFNKALFKLYIPANVTIMESNSVDVSSCSNLSDIYLYGDIPQNYNAQYHVSPFINGWSSNIPTLHYVDGQGYGWTTPTWTDWLGTVFNTKTFIPGSEDEGPSIDETLPIHYFGNNNQFYWQFNPDTKTLVVGGSGALPYYSTPLWSAHSNEIQQVVFQEGITYISSYILRNCRSVAVITLPASLNGMDESAFGQTGNVQQYAVSADSERYYTVDGALFEWLEDGSSKLMFFPCGVRGTTYRIPEGVTEINKDALSDCSFANIYFPDSLTYLGWSVVGMYVSGTVYIPESITDHHERAFFNAQVGAFEVAEGNAYYTSYEGNLYNKDMTSLIAYAAQNPRSSFAVPDGVQSIPNGIMNVPGRLQTLHIPASVTEIRDEGGGNSGAGMQFITVDPDNTAFCAVEDVIFTKDMTELVYYPIQKANTDYRVPDGVMRIRKNAFHYTRNLQTLTFPASLTYMDGRCFFYPSNLTKLYFLGDVPANLGSENLSPFYLRAFPTIYYIASASGWTTPTWTNAYNQTFTTAVFTPGETDTDLPENPASDFSYTIYDSYVQIDRYNGEGGDVVIPSLIEGLPVTHIGGWAFSGAKVTSVTIPDTITSWGSNVFLWCNRLTTIMVNGSNGSFFSVDGVLMERSGSDVILRAYPTGKPAAAYTVPEMVTKIGPYAFFGISCIENLSFAGSIKEIGKAAFEEMSIRGTLHIPSDFPCLTYNHGDSLCVAAIDLGVENPHMQVVDNVLYTKDMKTLILYPGFDTRTTFAVPEGVQTIHGCMLYYQRNLQHLTIPATLTNIVQNTLYTNSSLVEIHVDESNPYFSSLDGVLYNKAKTELLCYPTGKTEAVYTFPDTLQTVRNIACYGNNHLQQITFPEGLSGLHTDAFLNCQNLNAAYFMGNAPACLRESYQEEMPFRDMASNFTVYHLADKTGWTSPWLGYNTAVFEAVEEPEPEPDTSMFQYQVSSDGAYVTITGYTGTDADVVIPETIGGLPVTGIGEYAFTGNWDMRTVRIPASVTSIDDSAFFKSGIASILVEEASEKFLVMDGVLMERVAGGLKLKVYPTNKDIASYTVPETVIALGLHAFDRAFLEDLVIPDTISVLPAMALEFTNIFGTLYLPASVQITGYNNRNWAGNEIAAVSMDPANPYMTQVDHVLYSKDMSEIILYPNKSTCETYTVPDTVTSITSGLLFLQEHLKHLIIPASVTNIVDIGWFAYNTLTSISVAADNPAYSSVDGVLFDKNKTTLLHYPAQKEGSEYFIPETVESIPAGAFCYNNFLETVHIPASVTQLCTGTFTELHQLQAAYFYGDVPAVTRDWYGGIFNSPSDDFTLYYAAGKNGWTAPTWTDPIDSTKQYASASFEVMKEELTLPADAPYELLLLPGTDDKYLDGLKAGSNTADTIHALFGTAGVTVKDKTGKVLTGEALVGTGAVVQLIDNSGMVLDTVTLVLTGDLDGTGAADALDRYTLAQHIAGWNDRDLDPYALLACDVNGDGYVTAKDRLTLARHVAKWSGYETLGD